MPIDAQPGSPFGLNDTETVSCEFDLEELWYLQQRVRAEVENQGTWSTPPSHPGLNDDINYAILGCVERQENIATIALTLRRCRVLDTVVVPGDKGRGGHLVGDSILLKMFAAKRDLEFAQSFPVADSYNDHRYPKESDNGTHGSGEGVGSELQGEANPPASA